MENRKARIALVRGPILFRKGAVNNEATPGIAFAYISAYLRQNGYDPTLIDGIAEGLNKVWRFPENPDFFCQGLPFSEIIERIPDGVDVIGFSGMFSGEWPALRHLITKTREHFPDALFVAGGEHVTALTEYSLRDCAALDVCVLGEGERTFLEVIQNHECQDGVQSVNGIGYLDESDDYCQTEVAQRIRNIDEIPWPYWPEGYLQKFWAAGKSFGETTGRDIPFIASRGCPYQCTFCSNANMWTTRYILRDVDDVISEIKHYIEQYQITSLQFYDLTVIMKKPWILKFCSQLKRENINVKWSLPTGTRSEALDRETLTLLKETGCSYLTYAPESGSRNTLANIKKRIKLEQITTSILEAKGVGLTVRANLIIGFPGEQWRDIFKTIFYGLSLSMRGVDEVPIFIFSPYPGTEIFRDLIEGKHLTIDNAYFYQLTSLNSNFLTTNIETHGRLKNPGLLAALRTVALQMNYLISYLFYPSRILRTLRSFKAEGISTTAFENRLKGMLSRRKERGSP